MSKAARLQLLQKNLAQKTNNFEDIENDYAYAIWIVEKEFCVGKITDEFPALKLWNLLDEENIERFNESMKSNDVSGSGVPNTFGR